MKKPSQQHSSSQPSKIALSFYLMAIVVPLACTGCWRGKENEVVVYTALDEQFASLIFTQFTQQSGTQVLPKFDTESTKTVGLVQAILREQERPRCDLFWNNEILHTLRLERLGLLEAYLAPAATHFPIESSSPEGNWHAFAARARVLLVNTDLVPREAWPDSIHDLTDSRWKGQVGIAKPLFGTSATHMAVLMATWGEDRTREFYTALQENARIESGNKQVALAVARGELAFGLTDTDDAITERDHGHPVEIIYPDQGDDQLGTLLIPNTLCLLRGSPHPEAARQLVDFLLSGTVERELAAGHSAQFPLSDQVEERSRAAPERPIRQMEVDWPAAADQWEKSAQLGESLFLLAP